MQALSVRTFFALGGLSGQGVGRSVGGVERIVSWQAARSTGDRAARYREPAGRFEQMAKVEAQPRGSAERDFVDRSVDRSLATERVAPFEANRVSLGHTAVARVTQ